MSFPKDSAFSQQAAMEAAAGNVYVPPAEGLNAPTRRVGQAGIIEIPLAVLEGWLYDLEVTIDAHSSPELEDMKQTMRSYLRG